MSQLGRSVHFRRKQMEVSIVGQLFFWMASLFTKLMMRDSDKAILLRLWAN